ncbi:TetR family transcriptional regulator [Glutamicibacter sp.]|uniref:TetR/AcrR family transcriptional regulator n=1 Tax=Glutamicibacter sp. TaxID=1931995 RepID=UPI0028BE8710|nr:TetR family transcriptional regulator [Glutamicibacter sp.]
MARKPLTHEALLEMSRSCAALLNEVGAEASTTELVAAAGVSERTFFRYFPMKADCLRPIMEDGYHRFVAAVERQCVEGSSADLLEIVRTAFISSYGVGEEGLDRRFLELITVAEIYRRLWLAINEETMQALYAPMSQVLNLPTDHIDVRLAADAATRLAVESIRLMALHSLSAEQAATQVADALRRHPLMRPVAHR